MATDARSWRRDVPTARNRASSRVRCASVIENALLMVSIATTSAMPAKTTSSARRASRNDELVELLVDQLPTGDRLDAAREHVVDATLQLGRRHAFVGSHQYGADLVGIADHVRLRGGQRERGERRLAHAVLVTERRDADDADTQRIGRLDRRGVAHLEVTRLCGAAVDDDLTRSAAVHGPRRGGTG